MLHRYLLLLTLFFGLAPALYAQQPFERFGVKVKVLTLSNGRYQEFFTNDSLRRIGSVVYDTRLRKIAYLLPPDSLIGRIRSEVTSRWVSPDPLAEKMMYITPYAYGLNNPVRFFDPDGRFPYTFHIRAFAPTGAFKPTSFHDDGRGFSSRTDVTSRIKQDFTVDPTARSVSGGRPTSDPTVWHGMSSTAQDDGGISKPAFGRNSAGSATATLTSNFEGSNPFFLGAAPDIDVSSALSITENLKNGTVTVAIDLESKNFPATEALVQDRNGRTVFLGGAAAFGSPDDLRKNGDKTTVSSVNLVIGINKKGEFQNVSVGGQTYSIDAFNKMGTSQPAGPFKREEKDNR